MRKLYLVLFACVLQFSAFSQSITIGTGTVTGGQSPWESFYGYSFVQTIYLASEINASGNITSVTFDFAGTALGNSDEIVVYMGNTTKSSFSSTTDWEPVSGLTEVFNGTLTGYTVPGPITITLTTPFAYNGTDNLVIAVDENKADYDGVTRFNGTTIAGSNRVLYYRNDVTNPDPFAPPATGTPNELNRSSTIANIIIDGLTPAPCQAVTGISVANITQTGAMASWSAPTAGNAPTGYEWEVRSSGAAGSGTTGLAASGTTATTDATITGLISASTYSLYVRSVCGVGIYAPWSGATALVTSCGPAAIPYSIDFEGSTNMPICTVTENAGAGNDWTVATSPGSGFTTNTLRYVYNATNPADAWFFTQGVTLTAGLSYRMSFRYGNNSVATYVESLEVKYGTDATAASMTDLVVDYPSIVGAAATNSVTDFTPATTGVYYFGFHAYSAADMDYLFVDDISVTITPTCDVPSSLLVSNVTSGDAQIDWTAPTIGSPSGYDVYYSTSNVAPTASTTPTTANVAGTTTSITGLAPATKYYIYVRTICGAAGSSTWSVADSFVTECVPTNTLSENFDGAVTPALPTCWTSILRGGSLSAFATVTTNATAANRVTAPNGAALYNSNSTATDDIILVSAPIGNLAAGTYRLTFYARNTADVQDIEVGTLDNNTSSATFTPLQTVDITTVFQKFVVDFTSYSGTDQYIGFRVVNATTYSTVYIDNVVWELIPACADPSGIVASNIATNDAQIDWTAPSTGSPSSYDVYYSTSNVDPLDTTTPTIATVASTTVNLTNLANSTDYYVWVRSNCTGGTHSVWTLGYMFSTACGVITAPTAAPQTLNSPTVLPNCWTEAKGILGSPTTFTSTASGWQPDDFGNRVTPPLNKAARLNIWNTTTADWLMTPSYDIGTTGNFQLEFDLAYTPYGDSTVATLAPDDKFVVLISTDNGVTWDMANVLRAWDALTPISNTREHVIIPLPTYTGTVMFAFYGESTVNDVDNNVYVDNVEIKSMGTVPVTLTSFKGERQGTVNVLTWNTATEQSNKGFELQRSADGVTFTTLAFVNSKAMNGTSTSPLDYRFTDERPFTGNSYYRLKQVNMDGRSPLSTVVLIKGTKVPEIVLSHIYPNPTKGELNVQIEAPANNELTLMITDMAGKVVYRRAASVVTGTNKLTINVAGYSAGTYLIKTVCSNGCEPGVRKFVKE